MLPVLSSMGSQGRHAQAIDTRRKLTCLLPGYRGKHLRDNAKRFGGDVERPLTADGRPRTATPTNKLNSNANR